MEFQFKRKVTKQMSVLADRLKEAFEYRISPVFDKELQVLGMGIQIVIRENFHTGKPPEELMSMSKIISYEEIEFADFSILTKTIDGMLDIKSFVSYQPTQKQFKSNLKRRSEMTLAELGSINK